MFAAALLLAVPLSLPAAAQPAPSSPGAAEAQALLSAARTLVAEAEFRRAVLAFRTAEAVARRAGAQAEIGYALQGAADALYRQGDLPPARRAADEALSVFAALGEPAGQAEAWNTIANVHHALGEYPESLAALRKASELWTAAGDRRGVARALNNIANVQRALGDYDESLSGLEQALRVFDEIDDRRSASVVTNSIGLVHFLRGDYPLALEYFLRSLAMKEALGNPYDIAGSFDSLGNVHRVRGAYALALDYFHRALKVRQEVGDKFGTLETWNNIGLVHFSQGEYALAIDAYRRGLRLNAAMGGTTLVPEALFNIASSARGLGQRARAEANYRESLRISRRGGYKAIEAENLHGLGRLALEGGRLEEAGALLTQALEVREALKDQAGVAEALNGVAAVSLAAGRPAEALARASRAAGIARTYEQPEALWEAETLSGRAYRKLGRPDAARRSLDEAVAVIEGLRLQVADTPQGGVRFLESKLSPYHELMGLALADGRVAEALALAERSKARALADLVQRGNAGIAPAMDDAERREEERLRRTLAALNARIQAERQRETPDADRLASLVAERAARRSAYESFQAAAQARRPELALRRGRSHPFTVAEAPSLFPDASVAVLEYAITEDDSYLFVLTVESGVAKLDFHRLGAGRRELAQRARRIRERLASRDLDFAPDARHLYRLLLGPALPRLKQRTHLVIVADGPLWEVPFQALQDSSGRYVIETAAVTYAPSLTVLRESMRRPPRSALPTVLAMGKADFASELGPLPDAERQVRLIGSIYGADRSATYLGADAREDRFKAEAPRYAILHLATHGVLDESSPLYSHVVLSPGAGGSSQDGLLEAWELMDLRLDADLVILSACETGRGRIAPGEGVVGTMWAAFVAGSQALLASQWKVDSESTTELMTAFHRGLARGSAGKAAHLRRASLELLRRPRYAHPFYWAGFVLVGNPY